MSPPPRLQCPPQPWLLPRRLHAPCVPAGLGSRSAKPPHPRRLHHPPVVCRCTRMAWPVPRNDGARRQRPPQVLHPAVEWPLRLRPRIPVEREARARARARARQRARRRATAKTKATPNDGPLHAKARPRSQRRTGERPGDAAHHRRPQHMSVLVLKIRRWHRHFARTLSSWVGVGGCVCECRAGTDCMACSFHINCEARAGSEGCKTAGCPCCRPSGRAHHARYPRCVLTRVRRRFTGLH